MSIAEYRQAIQDRLLTDSLVVRIQVVRERATVADAHLRARLTLIDGSLLEFSEYAQRIPDGSVRVLTYSYHWVGLDGQLIRRWDNAPHFPDLPGAPHHVHDGQANIVVSGQPMTLFKVLDEIAAYTARRFG